MRDDDEAAGRPVRRGGGDRRSTRDVLYVDRDTERAARERDDDRRARRRDDASDARDEDFRMRGRSDGRDRFADEEDRRDERRGADRDRPRSGDAEDRRDGRRTSGEADPQDRRRSGDRDRTERGDKDGDQPDGDQPDDADKSDAQDVATRRKRRPLVIGIAALVLLLLVGGGVYYWLSTRGKATTDDAYTDGNIVMIAPQVAGQVVALDVTDNQFVHKGDPLLHLDARQYVFNQEQAQGQLDATKAQIASQLLGVEIAKKNFPAALELAKANLDAAKANLALQQANYDRQKSLPKLATTQQEVDTTAANYQQAKAQVEQAQARLIQAEPVKQSIGQSQEQVSQLQGQVEQAQGRLDQARLNVEWSVVRAPQDGWVTRRNVNAGDYLSAGQQVLSLVTTEAWITANYKETELDGMRPGQAVKITVDAYPDLDLKGHVDSIQRGSGSKFSAFPAENATGNFIKIVQRVPVKIVIDSGLKPEEPLPLGVSVVPTVMLK